MSWNVYLNDKDGNVIQFDNAVKQIGGNICIGELFVASASSVTYNYSKHYNKFFDGGFSSLDKMSAKESMPLLAKAIAELDPDTENPSDYWEPTEGNARRVLVEMLNWAVERPDGIWEIT